jgi:hypothetical protein
MHRSAGFRLFNGCFAGASFRRERLRVSRVSSHQVGDTAGQ